jgi:hypothetical protein
MDIRGALVFRRRSRIIPTYTSISLHFNFGTKFGIKFGVEGI